MTYWLNQVPEGFHMEFCMWNWQGVALALPHAYIYIYGTSYAKQDYALIVTASPFEDLMITSCAANFPHNHNLLQIMIWD